MDTETEAETGGGDEKETPKTTNQNPSHQHQEIAKKAKSCKGTLYYSSNFKSKSRNPLCVGITRSLGQVPRHIIGESEMEASREGRNLIDFRYGCVGYSVYRDGKNTSKDMQESPAELPVCVGLEVLVDKRVVGSETAPAHARTREDGHNIPQNRAPKPAHSVADDFMTRFTRNANVVANGVLKNLRKVGNHVKDRVDDIIFPYRRPPK